MNTVRRGFLLLMLLVVPFGACQKDDGRLYRIARDKMWYPLELLGKERNLEGFTNDLIREIAKEGGFRVELVDVSSEYLFHGLDFDRYDGVLSSMQPTALTRGDYEFSKPFFLLGPVLIVSQNSEISSLKEMQGKIIGISSSLSVVFDLKEYDIRFIVYDTMTLALEQLEDNRIDGVIMPALPAHIYTQGFYKGVLKVVTAPLTQEGLRLVTRQDPGSLRLVSRFNKGLRRVRRKDIYDKLIQRWQLILKDNK